MIDALKAYEKNLTKMGTNKYMGANSMEDLTCNSLEDLTLDHCGNSTEDLTSHSTETANGKPGGRGLKKFSSQDDLQSSAAVPAAAAEVRKTTVCKTSNVNELIKRARSSGGKALKKFSSHDDLLSAPARLEKEVQKAPVGKTSKTTTATTTTRTPSGGKGLKKFSSEDDLLSPRRVAAAEVTKTPLKASASSPARDAGHTKPVTTYLIY